MDDIAFSSIDLHPENVYGHTKKVRLTIEAIRNLRSAKDRRLKILDIGCGSGFAVTQFLAIDGDDVLGIDFYQPNIDYAQKHFGSDCLSFACLDATQLRDEGNKYDVVVLTDVLEHLHQPEKILQLARDLLADDGIVVVSIPNGFGPYEIESYIHKLPVVGRALDRLFAAWSFVLNRSVFKGRWTELNNRQPGDLPYNYGSPHVQWFTEGRFRRVVEESGLMIVDFRKLSVFSGPFSNYLFGPFIGLCERNNRLADRLPTWAASAWWMKLQKREPA